MLWFGTRPSPAQIEAERRAHMLLFDQLGPLARAAVNDSPVDVELRNAVRELKTRHRTIDAEGFARDMVLTDPDVDARLAALIDEKVRQRTGRAISEHVLTARRTRRPTRNRWR